nr:unnamed protein product [Callosobruchus analis]
MRFQKSTPRIIECGSVGITKASMTWIRSRSWNGKDTVPNTWHFCPLATVQWSSVEGFKVQTSSRRCQPGPPITVLVAPLSKRQRSSIQRYQWTNRSLVTSGMRQDVVQHHGVPIRLKCCDHVRICPDPFGNWPTIAGSWRSFLEGNCDEMPRWHSRGHTGSRRSSVVGYTYGTYVPATCSSNKAVDLIHRPETSIYSQGRNVWWTVQCRTSMLCRYLVPGTTNLFSINMDNGHVNNGFGLMECHCKPMCLRLGLPYIRLEYLVNTNRNCLYS